MPWCGSSDPHCGACHVHRAAGHRGPGRRRISAPRYDPDAARAALADAGYPGGAGFPAVTLVTGGSDYEDAVIADLQRELGITITAEDMPFDEYSDRLDTDTPQMWSLGWSADYPHPNDFLGLLLETGSPSNPGRLERPGVRRRTGRGRSDRRRRRAGGALRRRAAHRAGPGARHPAPYGETWALSRDGLLGASESGMGIVRYAGLEWADR